MDCLFCKIAGGEIPSKKIYEDDEVYAFADIDPQAPFHGLVIPKEHISSAAEITPENSAVVAHIFEVIAKIAKENGLEGLPHCFKCRGARSAKRKASSFSYFGQTPDAVASGLMQRAN